MLYRIWSIEHHAWWKNGSQGYTEKIDEAGIFKTSQAYRIVFDANSYDSDTPQEALVPVQ